MPLTWSVATMHVNRQARGHSVPWHSNWTGGRSGAVKASVAYGIPGCAGTGRKQGSTIS